MGKHCGLTRHRSNGHCKVRSLIHRVKCDCSVERIVTSTNNLTASKLFRFLLHNTRDVTRGQGGTILRAPNHCGRPKNTNNDISTFFKIVHLLPKDLRFEHRCGKLISCPRYHLSLLRPCTMHITIV